MPLTPPVPIPLPPWARLLVKVAEIVVPPAAAVAYDYISDASDQQDIQWRYAVARFQRTTPSGTTEDFAQTAFNIINVTNGDIDSSWTAGDYTAVDAALQEFWTAITVQMSSSHTLTEIRYYVRAFDPALPLGESVTNPAYSGSNAPRRFAASGPPVHVHPVGITGSVASSAMPYQVAMSGTLKTPAAAHWGRLYIPGLAFTLINGATGRWGTSAITVVANQLAELGDDLAAGGFQLIVPHTQMDNKFAVGYSNVTSVQVDDIPDVQRRRRARTAAVRVIGTPLA